MKKAFQKESQKSESEIKVSEKPSDFRFAKKTVGFRQHSESNLNSDGDASLRYSNLNSNTSLGWRPIPLEVSCWVEKEWGQWVIFHDYLLWVAFSSLMLLVGDRMCILPSEKICQFATKVLFENKWSKQTNWLPTFFLTLAIMCHHVSLLSTCHVNL